MISGHFGFAAGTTDGVAKTTGPLKCSHAWTDCQLYGIPRNSGLSEYSAEMNDYLLKVKRKIKMYFEIYEKKKKKKNISFFFLS